MLNVENGNFSFNEIRPGQTVLFNKITGAFVVDDSSPVSMADAVFFAECVIDVLTNFGGMFVAENMEPEFIDMYNKSLNK